MVAIIDKHKPTIADIFFKVLSFFCRKLHQFVPTQITKRAPEDLITTERNDILLCVDLQGGVFDQ